MRATHAILKIPAWNELPLALRARYSDRQMKFDTHNRLRSQRKHRELLAAIRASGQRLVCDCRRDGGPLEVMVRMRDGSPYLATMPRTGRSHDSACAFHRLAISSHTEAALTQDEEGIAVRLGFRLGEALAKKPPSAPSGQPETPLRSREVQHQYNRFGPEGLLRLLMDRAGLNLWRPGLKLEHRYKDGSWSPAYGRMLGELERTQAKSQKPGTLKDYLRIGGPAAVLKFNVGATVAVIDVITKVEPPKNGKLWKCYLAGWGKTFLLIAPGAVENLLLQLRMPRTRAAGMVACLQSATARETETWWGCFVCRVEKSETGKWLRVVDHAAVRSDRHGIPAESLAEIEMTEYLIAQGRSFTKPLFPGWLAAVPHRRPDFILEDTAVPCCLEVAGLDGCYDYDDRDNARLEDYRKAKIPCLRWQAGTDKPALDGAFAWVKRVPYSR